MAGVGSWVFFWLIESCLRDRRGTVLLRAHLQTLQLH